jgi:hypothetical protein
MVQFNPPSLRCPILRCLHYLKRPSSRTLEIHLRYIKPTFYFLELDCVKGTTGAAVLIVLMGRNFGAVTVIGATGENGDMPVIEFTFDLVLYCQTSASILFNNWRLLESIANWAVITFITVELEIVTFSACRIC